MKLNYFNIFAKGKKSGKENPILFYGFSLKEIINYIFPIHTFLNTTHKGDTKAQRKLSWELYELYAIQFVNTYKKKI
jgi:hypothetical protein